MQLWISHTIANFYTCVNDYSILGIAAHAAERGILLGPLFTGNAKVLSSVKALKVPLVENVGYCILCYMGFTVS